MPHLELSPLPPIPMPHSQYPTEQWHGDGGQGGQLHTVVLGEINETVQHPQPFLPSVNADSLLNWVNNRATNHHQPLLLSRSPVAK